jgi:hypothetical protein
VLTLLVLLVDASIKSRSQTPARLLSGQVWVDRVVPLITQSNVSGRDFQELRTGSATLRAVTLGRDLTAMTAGTRSTYEAYETLKAPTSLAAPASLLGACLLLRSQATVSVVAAIKAQLAGPAGDPARTESRRLASAVRQLELADSAYSLFAGRMPTSIAGRMPPSTWVQDASLYTQASLSVWLKALHSRVSLVAVNSIQIVAVSTTPAPLSLASRVETLPASPLHVSVVVGNTGNRAQGELRVKATVSRATGPASVSDLVAGLPVGSDTTVTLGPLSPKIGVTVTLIVTVSPLRGSPTRPVTRTISFLMPSATSTSTSTSTTTAPATTTVPTAASTTPGAATTVTTAPPQTSPTTPAPTTPTTAATTTTSVTRPSGG